MRIKKSNFVSKFLLPYLLVLVIPIAIGTTIYQKTISVIETETARSNMTLLNQSKEIIDRRLDELDRIVQQIMLDPNLITYQYIEHPFDGSNTARTIEMKKSLVNYNLFNTFISNYYVLFSSSKLVMTPTSVYDLPTFYQQVLQRGDWNYETWTNLTIDQYHSRSIEPASAYTIEGKEQKMVTYIQSLGLPSHTYATVVMLIDNQEFAKLLRGLDISDGGIAYIADQNGQIISYIADDDQPVAAPAFRRFPDAGGTIFPSAQTGNVMTTYTTSSYNGWTYVVSQPAHIALQKATYIKNTMIAIFVLSLAAGLIIAILMAYRSFRPVRFLFQTIDSLKINNDALLQEMEKQRPMLRFAFFERLLKGELPHADDRNPVMERLGIRLDGSACRVAVVSLCDDRLRLRSELLPDPDLLHVKFKDIVSRLSDAVYVHELNGNRAAVILSSPAGCTDEGTAEFRAGEERFLRSLMVEMHKEMYGNPSIGAGNAYSDLEQLPLSYREAQQALDYTMGKGMTGLVHFRDLPQNNSSYSYPPEVEMKLVNAIKVGHQGDVKTVFAGLLHENMEKRNLSAVMMKLLLNDLKGTVAKLGDQISIDDPKLAGQIQALLAPADRPEDAQETMRAIERMCLHISDIVDRRKKSHNDQLLTNVMRMIHEQYRSSSFSLGVVAETFRISEVYVSYFIKEQTGVTFSEYVERLRMEQAKAMLMDDRYSVKDIAEQVGYNSSNTFCRAFKRMNGVSTTDYKKATAGV